MLKWCLNRPYQAKMTAKLTEMAGIKQGNETYKPLRQSEVNKEEKRVNDIMDVIENRYLNPFSLPDLDHEKLIIISSGDSLENEEILDITKNGKELAEKFADDRILSATANFQDRIPKVKVPSFCPVKTVRVRQNTKHKVIEANRYILSRLYSISTKTNRPINLEVALCYPLYHVPLSLAMPDEIKRPSSKSSSRKEKRTWSLNF